MEELYKDIKFIIAFLVLVLVIESTFGSQVSEQFLILVFVGMITVNSDKFIALINKAFRL